MKLWFVDDKRDDHETWANSFPEAIKASCELRSFSSVSELTDEFTDGDFPDILFLDFFIGEVLGIEVIRWFENKAVRPVLIAHSSMREASVGMVREGADFYLEKIKNRPYAESIRTAFQTIDDVTYIGENQAIREGP
jgi:CheY-like chemotaxis protein